MRPPGATDGEMIVVAAVSRSQVAVITALFPVGPNRMLLDVPGPASSRMAPGMAERSDAILGENPGYLRGLCGRRAALL
jgi:hypothetical protein